MLVSTQSAPHSVRPSGQPQVPLWQACPEGQPAPQSPQLAESVDVSTQLRPHASRSGGQLATHWPSEQNSSGAHAMPQPPQWKGEERESTHSPAHDSNGA
jgi:hypothetical protein